MNAIAVDTYQEQEDYYEQAGARYSTSLYTGEHFQVHKAPMYGIILVRAEDGADQYLQGDDATNFLDELDAALMAHKPTPAFPHRYNVIDYITGQYFD